MSTTRTAVSLPLKSMEMHNLKDFLDKEFLNAAIQSSLESLSDTELVLLVKKTGFQTIASITRPTHRPLEIEVEIDYNRVNNSKNVRMTRRSSTSQRSPGIFGFRFFWLFIFLASIFAGVLSRIGNSLSKIIGGTDDEISQDELNRLIILLIFVTLSSIIFWIYILPRIVRQRGEFNKKFDLEVLNIIVNGVKRLNDQRASSQIIRCWSCFEKIEFTDNVCPFCGKHQK